MSRARNTDRASDLPLEIQGRILSLLPLQEAVRTSVLSKQWRQAWLSIPTLDLQIKVIIKNTDSPLPTWELSHPTPNLNLILSQLPNTSIPTCHLSLPDLPESNPRRKFHLKIPSMDKKWFFILRARGLAELSLSANGSVPISLLSRLGETLSVLSFNWAMLACNHDKCVVACRRKCVLPETLKLGTLKKVQIHGRCLCTRALEGLLSKCPALDSLVVDLSTNISSPLDISSCPKLRFLEYRSSWVEFKFDREVRLEIAKMVFLMEPFYDEMYKKAPKVTKLMCHCRLAHTLSMSLSFVKCFSWDFSRKGWDYCTGFPNLRKLSLEFSFSIIWDGHEQVFLIDYLLKVSPRLQELELTYKEAHLLRVTDTKEDVWMQVNHFGSLRRVKICKDLPIGLVRYLLRSSPVLETLSCC